MSTEPNRAIKADKAQVSPLALAPKVAPTSGAVTVPGASYLAGRQSVCDEVNAGQREFVDKMVGMVRS